jgi:RNA polymerase sigma-70 factor (ECF subfamily)
VRTEDAERFAGLYEEHVWSVYGFFGYRLRSRELAEDLTQRTFENALKSWHRFDEERGSFGTWLIAIARNLLVDHYRRGGSTEEISMADDALPEPREPASLEARLGLSPELEQALGALGERERELIALRFGGDLTGPEIAELTGLTVANVQQILSRALRRLRGELEPPAGAAAEAEGRSAG